MSIRKLSVYYNNTVNITKGIGPEASKVQIDVTWISLVVSVGSCCLIGIICSGELYIANAGDSRAVLGRLDEAMKEIKAIQLSVEHNASHASVREELHSLHPNDPQIVVMKHQVWRVKGLIQVTFNFSSQNSFFFYEIHAHIQGLC